jgi:hypothetical protein
LDVSTSFVCIYPHTARYAHVSITANPPCVLLKPLFLPVLAVIRVFVFLPTDKVQFMSESSFIHSKLDPPFTLVVLARFPMKLATILHSLGLTGSIFDLPKTIITVDTYINRETPLAKSRLRLVLTASIVMGLWYCICYRPCTLDTSFSFMSCFRHRRA